MLVLAMKIGKSIMIGDDVEIILKDIKGNNVFLEIVLPASLNVCKNGNSNPVQKSEDGKVKVDLRMNQYINITEDVKVSVQRSTNNKVYLGFEAPRSLSILRSELCERDWSGEKR